MQHTEADKYPERGGNRDVQYHEVKIKISLCCFKRTASVLLSNRPFQTTIWNGRYI